MEVKQLENRLIHNWLYKSSKETISVNSKICLPISPNLEEIDGKITYSFDRQLILDMGVQVGALEEPHDPDLVKNRVCKICRVMIKLDLMRVHVAKHILKDEVGSSSNICGWCGENSCSNRL